MRAFADGVRLKENEDEYQAGLREYHSGFVVILTRGRNGRYTLHRAICATLSYRLELKGKGQTSRAPKYLFYTVVNLYDNAVALGIDVLELNHCNRCKP